MINYLVAVLIKLQFTINSWHHIWKW